MFERLFQRIREFFSPTQPNTSVESLQRNEAPAQPASNETGRGADIRFPESAVPTQVQPQAEPVLAIEPVVVTEPVASTVLHAYVGDITKYDGDAIVNAANSQLAAGGGVCGAIFRAAGHIELQNACDEAGYCPTGQARTTPGFGLQAKYVVHAVGPIFEEGQDNAALLASAYRSSLEEALRVGAKSIAFPAISTGIYGYPLVEATTVAVQTVSQFCAENPGIDRVDFTCFSPEILLVYQEALEALAQPRETHSYSM